MSESAIDQKFFRQVLGQYPTGVCVVTAMMRDGTPAAMVVGSFTSVSLGPPLVAFLPDKKTSSWRKMERCGSFCVNILGAKQEGLCRRLPPKREQPIHWQTFTPPRSAQRRRSSGLFCHRRAQAEDYESQGPSLVQVYDMLKTVPGVDPMILGMRRDILRRDVVWGLAGIEALSFQESRERCSACRQSYRHGRCGNCQLHLPRKHC